MSDPNMKNLMRVIQRWGFTAALSDVEYRKKMEEYFRAHPQALAKVLEELRAAIAKAEGKR